MLQHDFILLDRSGSMSGLWQEALGGINSYVKKLADDNVDTGVTLIVFDGNNSFEIIRDRITPKTWKPVTNADASPRGATPLNDAIAKTVQLAHKGSPWGEKYGRVSFVIATDGYENASVEYSILNGGTAKVKAMLDECRKAGWAITYLGANFDNMNQAAAYGGVVNQTVSTTAANFGNTMFAMAGKRSVYGLTGDVEVMSWTVDEQAAAKTDKK